VQFVSWSIFRNDPCRDLVCISGVIVARSFGQPQGISLPSWKPDAVLEKLGKYLLVAWKFCLLNLSTSIEVYK